MTEQTTMQAMRGRDNELRKRMFETMMEAFVRRWQPPIVGSADQGLAGDNAQFHGELHSLIRQVYADAQAPLLEQMTKLISVMPMYPLVARKPE